MRNFDSINEVMILKEVWFSSIITELRVPVMYVLNRRFSRLSWEDLEEVYMDGCLVVYTNMLNGKVELDDESFVKYLTRVCLNVGMHYLRNVRDCVLSIEGMIDGDFFSIYNTDDVMDEMFYIFEDSSCDDEEEKLARLSSVWEKLSDIDRIILVSYYWEGLSMEEIKAKIGYKSVASVKNKKSRCLKMMLEKIKEERVVSPNWNVSSYCWLPCIA
ncbi:MAG: sigma-70 family RNA polymerase sigma factor [Muribaculaceae bacterium]|nr:sigma-70 family RNA polymerase sigma factor [Muribaculaceae bacterium]